MSGPGFRLRYGQYFAEGVDAIVDELGEAMAIEADRAARARELDRRTLAEVREARKNAERAKARLDEALALLGVQS